MADCGLTDSSGKKGIQKRRENYKLFLSVPVSRFTSARRRLTLRIPF
jgi:hypothetical protein